MEAWERRKAQTRQKRMQETSERITHCKMQAEAIPELFHIIISLLARVVWSVYANAKVEAKDEEIKVVSDSSSCAEGYLIQETAHTQLTIRVG